MLELSVITVLTMFPDVSCNPENAVGLSDSEVWVVVTGDDGC